MFVMFDWTGNFMIKRMRHATVIMTRRFEGRKQKSGDVLCCAMS